IFNLVDVRQMDRSLEKQRISNIKVIGVDAIKLGNRLPTTVTFTFEHVGKSIVRSDGHFYSFEPNDAAKQVGARSYVGVSVETKGGKREDSPGWTEATIDGRQGGRLSPNSLWPSKLSPPETLLSKLLGNKTLALSQFRPGAFSDFVL